MLFRPTTIGSKSLPGTSPHPGCGIGYSLEGGHLRGSEDLSIEAAEPVHFGLGHPADMLGMTECHPLIGPNAPGPDPMGPQGLGGDRDGYIHQESTTMPVIHSEGAEPGQCAACGGKIIDRYYLLAVDKQWHVNCLKCSECKLPLDSELTCFAKDGNIYCKEDYYRRFALKRCARCHMGISAHELVMRARDFVYHLNCFTCASCNKMLTTGEHFGMKENMIYCRIHYELVLQGEFMPPNGMGDEFSDSHGGNAPSHGVPFYNGVGAVQKGRPRKRKSHLETDSDHCSQSLGMGLHESDLCDLSAMSPGTLQQRQKRMRTSFKHHQLRAMKMYFALNHNPDAKDLKELAQKTGLSKRVLQVWFQNARAKYRRNLLKQEQDKNGGIGSQEGGKNTLTELSNARSPALSDVSSSPSLSELQNNSSIDNNDQSSSGSGLTELFSTSLKAMN